MEFYSYIEDDKYGYYIETTGLKKSKMLLGAMKHRGNDFKCFKVPLDSNVSNTSGTATVFVGGLLGMSLAHFVRNLNVNSSDIILWVVLIVFICFTLLLFYLYNNSKNEKIYAILKKNNSKEMVVYLESETPSTNLFGTLFILVMLLTDIYLILKLGLPTSENFITLLILIMSFVFIIYLYIVILPNKESCIVLRRFKQNKKNK